MTIVCDLCPREVFKQKSDYQDVWIAHSSRYGNMLFLDLEESKLLIYCLN